VSARKTAAFLADVEQQFEWYAHNATWEVAERYLDAVESTCLLVELHPGIGPLTGFAHPRLRDWRFFVVLAPFRKHILFYEPIGGDVIFRRAMHGHRDFARRLLDPPANP
jgi:plasmid stabilization system protein ParE